MLYKSFQIESMDFLTIRSLTVHVVLHKNTFGSNIGCFINVLQRFEIQFFFSFQDGHLRRPVTNTEATYFHNNKQKFIMTDRSGIKNSIDRCMIIPCRSRNAATHGQLKKFFMYFW